MPSRPTDIMIKCLGSFIKDGDYVFHGLNSIIPQLAMAYASLYLRKDFVWHGVTEQFMIDPKSFKAYPSSGDPNSGKDHLGIVTMVDAFDIASKGLMDLMYFGAAQIDEEANINLSVIGNYENPRVRLPGGAAVAYLYPLVKRIIIWSRHDPRVLVKKVDFITASGRRRIENNMKTLLCTNKALIEFTKDGPMLRAIFEGLDVNDVISSTGGMSINLGSEVSVISSLSSDELEAITSADPDGLRYEENYG